MKSKDKYISSFIEKHLATIKQEYQPQGLWLFGSRVTGLAKDSSDLDLILVSEHFKDQKFIYRMGNFLKKFDFPIHIDALCYTPKEFARKRQEIGIIKEGIEKGEKII
ncbi:MAG: nucleotidyltransferase domain-containing protein [bacterium]